MEREAHTGGADKGEDRRMEVKWGMRENSQKERCKIVLVCTIKVIYYSMKPTDGYNR